MEVKAWVLEVDWEEKAEGLVASELEAWALAVTAQVHHGNRQAYCDLDRTQWGRTHAPVPSAVRPLRLSQETPSLQLLLCAH
jgi:hypothetical protein